MKKLFAIAGSTLIAACTTSTPESAVRSVESRAESTKAPARWVCSEYDRSDDSLKQRTVVLYQTDDQGLVEGSPLAFSLELYDGADTSATMSVDGKVEHEDVIVNFSSDDGKVAFNLYLDEMNESGLRLDGQDSGDFVCRDVAGTEASNAALFCSEYDRSTDKLLQRTVVLTQTDGKGLKEGEKLAFNLETFTGAETYTEQTTKGSVETEDVMFLFNSQDSSVNFRVYLDEMNESSMSVNGADAGDFVCR